MKRVAVTVFIIGVLAASAAAAVWPGPPRTAAPPLAQQGPPPAWVETRTQTRWMAFSSYCWSAPAGTTTRKSVCADMIPPQSRTDLPTVTVRRGDVVRIHLAYVPRGAHLTVFQQSRFRHYVLRTGRLLTWRASNAGIVSIDTRAAAGEAAYLFRLRLRH